MKCPCKKSCERRSATCRLDCEPYLEYAEQKMAQYARNAVHSNNAGTTPAQERRVRELKKKEKGGADTVSAQPNLLQGGAHHAVYGTGAGRNAAGGRRDRTGVLPDAG